jgi:hypothetical protein
MKTKIAISVFVTIAFGTTLLGTGIGPWVLFGCEGQAFADEVTVQEGIKRIEAFDKALKSGDLQKIQETARLLRENLYAVELIKNRPNLKLQLDKIPLSTPKPSAKGSIVKNPTSSQTVYSKTHTQPKIGADALEARPSDAPKGKNEFSYQEMFGDGQNLSGSKVPNEGSIKASSDEVKAPSKSKMSGSSRGPITSADKNMPEAPSFARPKTDANPLPGKVERKPVKHIESEIIYSKMPPPGHKKLTPLEQEQIGKEMAAIGYVAPPKPQIKGKPSTASETALSEIYKTPRSPTQRNGAFNSAQYRAKNLIDPQGLTEDALKEALEAAKKDIGWEGLSEHELPAGYNTGEDNLRSAFRSENQKRIIDAVRRVGRNNQAIDQLNKLDPEIVKLRDRYVRVKENIIQNTKNNLEKRLAERYGVSTNDVEVYVTSTNKTKKVHTHQAGDVPRAGHDVDFGARVKGIEVDHNPLREELAPAYGEAVLEKNMDAAGLARDNIKAMSRLSPERISDLNILEHPQDPLKYPHATGEDLGNKVYRELAKSQVSASKGNFTGSEAQKFDAYRELNKIGKITRERFAAGDGKLSKRTKESLELLDRMIDPKKSGGKIATPQELDDALAKRGETIDTLTNKVVSNIQGSEILRPPGQQVSDKVRMDEFVKRVNGKLELNRLEGKSVDTSKWQSRKTKTGYEDLRKTGGKSSFQNDLGKVTSQTGRGHANTSTGYEDLRQKPINKKTGLRGKSSFKSESNIGKNIVQGAVTGAAVASKLSKEGSKRLREGRDYSYGEALTDAAVAGARTIPQIAMAEGVGKTTYNVTSRKTRQFLMDWQEREQAVRIAKLNLTMAREAGDQNKINENQQKLKEAKQALEKHKEEAPLDLQGYYDPNQALLRILQGKSTFASDLTGEAGKIAKEGLYIPLQKSAKNNVDKYLAHAQKQGRVRLTPGEAAQMLMEIPFDFISEMGPRQGAEGLYHLATGWAADRAELDAEKQQIETFKHSFAKHKSKLMHTQRELEALINQEDPNNPDTYERGKHLLAQYRYHFAKLRQVSDSTGSRFGDPELKLKKIDALLNKIHPPDSTKDQEKRYESLDAKLQDPETKKLWDTLINARQQAEKQLRGGKSPYGDEVGVEIARFKSDTDNFLNPEELLDYAGSTLLQRRKSSLDQQDKMASNGKDIEHENDSELSTGSESDIDKNEKNPFLNDNIFAKRMGILGGMADNRLEDWRRQVSADQDANRARGDGQILTDGKLQSALDGIQDTMASRSEQSRTDNSPQPSNSGSDQVNQKDSDQCITDSDCLDGYLCIDGDCLKQAKPVKCTKDNDCPIGHSCKNRNCVPAACGKNADCPLGYVCRDGQCVASRSDSLPERCSKNADCPEGYACRSGQCVKLRPDKDKLPSSCSKNADCPEAYACRSGQCVKLRPDEDKVPSSCSKNADCPEKYACRSGQCVKLRPDEDKVPSSCSKNADCPEKYACRSGQCVKLRPDKDKVPSSCSKNADCPDEYVCRGGQCVKLRPDKVPSSCGKNADCPKDYACRSGQCVKLRPETKKPDSCSRDSDCPKGKVCMGGSCVEKPCTPKYGCCEREPVSCMGYCWPRGTDCCGNAICRPGTYCCHNNCCNKGEICCDDGGCCPAGTYCCVKNGQNKCCRY